MDKAGVQAAFVAAGIPRLIKDIDKLARPSIRLDASPVAESILRMGASKLGGTPDLPSGVGWPELKGVPQSFIAQLHLADVHPYDTEHKLPRKSFVLIIIPLLLLTLSGCNITISTPSTSTLGAGTAGTPNWGVQTKTSGCVAHGGLADAACTPGWLAVYNSMPNK